MSKEIYGSAKNLRNKLYDFMQLREILVEHVPQMCVHLHALVLGVVMRGFAKANNAELQTGG